MSVETVSYRWSQEWLMRVNYHYISSSSILQSICLSVCLCVCVCVCVRDSPHLLHELAQLAAARVPVAHVLS